MPVRTLSVELQEKARIDLGEDPQRLQDGIQHLKDWVSKQPHLKARTDDQWLAAFLRGCKFSLERAKEKIDLYYSMRSLAPELFAIDHRNPKFKEILNLGLYVILPKQANPTAPRTILMRFGQYDPAKYHTLEIMSVMSIISKIIYVEDDVHMVCGGVGVMDLEGASMAHFSQMSPALMKKMTVLGQDAAPVRLKGAHYLNTPIGFETMFNIAKSFLNEKNKQRLHVHNKDYEALYKHVPKEILPTEYGGNGGSLKEIVDDWIKKIESYYDWLDEDLQYGTDESKRPGKPKTAEDMFGAEGSFRQLQID
ncbi:hypothetical protein MSG28_002137 [Choristoneura fumiferana]|uniref:Uncharacterized protein n=1 Tax=Choristoneura fumiferana TaxID=7141 RepID=A0ACC0JUV5_CHOFU|nr:hypothetical protein MSG28_002137 [Choristoneura fumiferana]